MKEFLNLKAIKLTPTIGAELTGIDFSKPLNQKDYDAIYDALIEHQVIFFRNQSLTPNAHVNFAKSFGSAIHPVVKLHPVTKKPFLYANPAFTFQIVGMKSSDSRRLLTYLYDHMKKPEFQVRFKWTKNTIAMWDNRCTMHCAIGDYLPHQRKMHRVTVTNDRRADSKTVKKIKQSA